MDISALDPKKSVRKAATLADSSEVDDVFSVMDVDDSSPQGFIEAIAYCRRKRTNYSMTVIISNPCFEIWLLAHYEKFINIM